MNIGIDILVNLITFAFSIGGAWALMNYRLKSSTDNNGNGNSSKYLGDLERKAQEMGQLMERVNNLNSMKDVVGKMQDRVADLAESVTSLTKMLTSDINDIKSRLIRLERDKDD